MNGTYPAFGTLCIGAGTSLTIFAVVCSIYKFLRKKVPLKKKVVLITGASSGLGEACAKAFYNAGCKIILCGRRKEELERVKQSLISSEIENSEEPIVAILDLTRSDEIEGVVREIMKSCACIDVLINNAGVSSRGSVTCTDIAVDRKIMEVNYFGQIILTKAIVPHMVDNGGGSIVAISSIQGRVGLPYRTSYGASKHALQGFCDCLRAEVSSNNINVCVVSPSYIHTQVSVNSILGDGRISGEMDKEIASGMLPAYVAERIVHAVVHRQNEVLVGPFLHRMAVYARVLLPSLFFYIMRKRAQGEKFEEKKSL